MTSQVFFLQSFIQVMNSTQHFVLRSRRKIRWLPLFYFAIVSSLGWLPFSELRADPNYKATAGKIAFSVGSNVPFLKVSGSSSTFHGGGEGAVAGDVATIRNLHFEVDPKTLKTGMSFRDQHMDEKVFTAADGSIPPIVLRADRFEAKRNPATSKWEGSFQAQVTMRGVTKPVRFHAAAEQLNTEALVSAQGVVKTSDFGVEPITYSGARVNDEVTVTVTNLRLEP